MLFHTCIPTDSVVCTGCCGTLDHIVTFFFKNYSKSKRKEAMATISPNQPMPFLQLLEIHSELFQQMLSTIMNTIMFEKCRNQWSMSRPLLGLILLNEDVSAHDCWASLTTLLRLWR